MRIAVLMTCHNRRDKTLECLDRLATQGIPFLDADARDSGVTTTNRSMEPRLSVYLVDDGCTDGTVEQVRNRFPFVWIIPGDGNLYWCGGMRCAWAQAGKEDFDAYLWLNDDTLLLPGALHTLLDTLGETTRPSPAAAGDETHESHQHALIVVGSTRDPDTGAATYGERSPSSTMSPPAVRPREVAWSFNGNLVLVSRAAYRILGNLSVVYRHSFGDVDYGIRARQAGIPVIVAPGFLGECRANGTPKWQRAEVPLADRWRALRGPKGISARQLRHLMHVQGTGVWWMSMAKLYCTVVAPRWFARGRQSP